MRRDRDAVKRAERQVGPCIRRGMLQPSALVYALHPTVARWDRNVRRYYEGIGEGDRAVALFRSHPEYAAPESLARGIREAIDAAEI